MCVVAAMEIWEAVCLYCALTLLPAMPVVIVIYCCSRTFCTNQRKRTRDFGVGTSDLLQDWSSQSDLPTWTDGQGGSFSPLQTSPNAAAACDGPSIIIITHSGTRWHSSEHCRHVKNRRVFQRFAPCKDCASKKSD